LLVSAGFCCSTILFPSCPRRYVQSRRGTQRHAAHFPHAHVAAPYRTDAFMSINSRSFTSSAPISPVFGTHRW
jgi:hypothetical protein